MAQRGAPIGNKNQSKNKPWHAAINRAIAQGDADKLRRIADKLLDMAEQGDIAAMREIGDRLDGKATQIHEGPGPNGEHTLNVTVNVVKHSTLYP